MFKGKMTIIGLLLENYKKPEYVICEVIYDYEDKDQYMILKFTQIAYIVKRNMLECVNFDIQDKVITITDKTITGLRALSKKSFKWHTYDINTTYEKDNNFTVLQPDTRAILSRYLKREYDDGFIYKRRLTSYIVDNEKMAKERIEKVMALEKEELASCSIHKLIYKLEKNDCERLKRVLNQDLTKLANYYMSFIAYEVRDRSRFLVGIERILYTFKLVKISTDKINNFRLNKD